MATPQSCLAYAPRGAGLLCALVYQEKGQDVYGWFIGSSNSYFPAAFFKLENFFSTQPTIFYATAGTDVYGGWHYNYASSDPQMGDPLPIEEDLCHELDQMQFVFASEWLFFEGEQHIEEELAAYQQMELPAQSVNIKSKMLNKLDTHEPVWTYQSKEFDPEVLEYLMPRWPLDYGRG